MRFEIDDIEEEWVYSSQFDLIHMRMLGGAIRDWPRLMRQIFKYGLSSMLFLRAKFLNDNLTADTDLRNREVGLS